MAKQSGMYFVDNGVVRAGVMAAIHMGETSLSELAGELGYERPHVGTLQRLLGMTNYVTRYDPSRRRVAIGLKAETGRRIFEIVAPEGEREEDWLVPVGPQYVARKAKRHEIGKGQGEAEWRYGMKVWGNGTPMVYSWRLRILVERAVREGRITMAELARELGYVKNDAAPLKRALGMKPTNSSGRFQTKMDEQTAIFLCRRLGYDPVDWGI